jgi:hypothetical protein
MESRGATVSAGEPEPSGSAAELERYRGETVVMFRERETDRKTNRNLRYFFVGVTAAGLVMTAVFTLAVGHHPPTPFTESGAGLILSGGGMIELRRLGRARRPVAP